MVIFYNNNEPLTDANIPCMMIISYDYIFIGEKLASVTNLSEYIES